MSEKNQINSENALTDPGEKFDNLKAENEDVKKQFKHKLLSRDYSAKGLTTLFIVSMRIPVMNGKLAIKPNGYSKFFASRSFK